MLAGPLNSLACRCCKVGVKDDSVNVEYNLVGFQLFLLILQAGGLKNGLLRWQVHWVFFV